MGFLFCFVLAGHSTTAVDDDRFSKAAMYRLKRSFPSDFSFSREKRD